MSTDSHPSEETLLAYAGDTLPDEEQELVEVHIAACDLCAGVARQAFEFDQLLSYSAKEHGDILRRAAVEEALAAQEAAAVGEVRDRLTHWRSRWAGRAETAARIVFDSARAGAEVMAEGLDSLLRPGSPWELSPAAGAAVRGTETPTDSALLTTSLSPGAPRARLAIQGGDSPEITVRIDGVPLDERPLVLLTATAPADPNLVRLVRADPAPGGGAYLLARFEDLPQGQYVVAVEPLDRGKGG